MSNTSSDAASGVGIVGTALKALIPSLPILLPAGALLVALPIWAQQEVLRQVLRATSVPPWTLIVPAGTVIAIFKGLFWGVVAWQLAPRLGLTGFVRPAGRAGGWLGWGLCLLVAAALQYLAIVVGAILLFVPGIIVGCMLFVAVPVAALEPVGPFQALSRSRALTKDNRMGIFGLQLLFGVPLFVVNFTAISLLGARAGGGFLEGMSSPLYLQAYVPASSAIYNLLMASVGVSVYVRYMAKTSAGSLAQVFD